MRALRNRLWGSHAGLVPGEELNWSGRFSFLPLLKQASYRSSNRLGPPSGGRPSHGGRNWWVTWRERGKGQEHQGATQGKQGTIWTFQHHGHLMAILGHRHLVPVELIKAPQMRLGEAETVVPALPT